MTTGMDDPLGLALLEALTEAQVFAVVDAAHFEFLQDTLTMERMTFDPLYLDEIEAPTIASGPHLIHVTGPKQIRKVRELIGDKPACVWWVWPDGPDAGANLYRHLRGLNMVEIPKDRYDVEPRLREAGFESVLFRHADPNVMSTIMQIFDPAQQARLFGSSVSIIAAVSEFEAEISDEIAEYKRPHIWESQGNPQISKRMLKIDHDQYESLGEIHRRIQYGRIVVELRPEFPDGTNRDFKAQTRMAFARAQEYGAIEYDDLLAFVALDLSAGAEFELDPLHRDARIILEDKTREPGLRFRDASEEVAYARQVAV